MGSSKFLYLDPFNEFDSLRIDQDEYDQMAAFSTNEDRSGEGITELSGDGSEWDDRNGDNNVFDLFEDSNDQRT